MQTIHDDLSVQVQDWAETYLDETGVRPQPGLVRDAQGHMVQVCLVNETNPQEAFWLMRLYLLGGAREMCWGLEHPAEPGDGLPSARFLAIYHVEVEAHRWRTGVLPYQHQPRLVGPLVWAHPYWQPRLVEEMRSGGLL